METKYIQKAKQLKQAGFWMAGFGHFDITTEELAVILQLVEENNFVEIQNMYERLEEERL